MKELALALTLIFCTPAGWIGMIVFFTAIMGVVNFWHS